MASATSSVFKERLLIAFKDKATLLTECQNIALEIQSGRAKLAEFVEELGPFVTDKDVSTREKGILGLTCILKELPKDFLNEKELHFITAFYCDRLKDHHSIIPPVIEGILAIVQMHTLPHDSPPLLLGALFANVPCQSQSLRDRTNIYLIFSTLLENRADDLKGMGPDFVYGVISAMDGERDPRNLILLFTILPTFLKRFPLGHLTEEMFEVISCYFPVDFNPGGSEATRISRNDLAEKLAPCLCAVPEFAEFCIPLLLDKLFSSLKIAKLDSLSLLRKGAPIFGVEGLKDHLTELWSALRKGIMPGSDAELKDASLKALGSIIEALSEDAGHRENFIDKIIVDTRSSLCDVQLSLFRPAEELLEAVAMINKESCVQVLRMIIPLCLGQYSTKTSIIDKIILLETLNRFIKISSGHGFAIKSVAELSWTDIPQIYLHELSTQNEELKSKTIVGLTHQKAYLNDTHRLLLYDAIHNAIIVDSDELRSVCHMCLIEFAVLYPIEILTFVNERLLLGNDKERVEVQMHKLEALSAVAKTRELGIQVLPHILTQTNAVNSEISFTAMKCLHRLVATKNIDYDIQHYLYSDCNVIGKLISLNINAADRRLNLISNICRLIVKALTPKEQQDIVNTYAAVLSRKITEIDGVFISNIFIPLRTNVDFKLSQDILENLYNLANNGSDLIIRQSACKFIAVMLNKMDSNEYFQGALSYFKERITHHLETSADIKTKEATVILQLWITKSLIVKGFQDAQSYLDILTDILKHDAVGQYLAQEYKMLVNKNEDSLTEENFCNVKFLYKQRVFEHLLRKDTEFDELSRQNYLTALVHMLEEVPEELLSIHLTKLVPLLVESLSLDNDQLIYSALVTLKLMLATKHAIFSEKVQSFIPRFLKLLGYRTMRVRITALECLTNYCDYPTILINPYKEDILEKLAVTVDDRKRLVRKAAVKARTKWFLVGAPGGLKDQ